MKKNWSDFERDCSSIAFLVREPKGTRKATWVTANGLEDYFLKVVKDEKLVTLVADVESEKLYNVVECKSDDEMIGLVRDCVGQTDSYQCTFVKSNGDNHSSPVNVDPMKQEFVTLVKEKDAI